MNQSIYMDKNTNRACKVSSLALHEIWGSTTISYSIFIQCQYENTIPTAEDGGMAPDNFVSEPYALVLATFTLKCLCTELTDLAGNGDRLVFILEKSRKFTCA